MTYLCPWNIPGLEYDGICSHSALAESEHLEDYELTEADAQSGVLNVILSLPARSLIDAPSSDEGQPTSRVITLFLC